MVLEQFSSIEEALVFLEEVESGLLQQDSPAMEQGRFMSHQQTWNPTHDATNTVVDKSASSSTSHKQDSTFSRGEARYGGGWHPGRFTPRKF